MKQVKLLKTAQIPDENHEGEGEPQSATNYAGAVLEVSDELAERLMEEGAAMIHVPQPVGDTAAAMTRTFDGTEE